MTHVGEELHAVHNVFAEIHFLLLEDTQEFPQPEAEVSGERLDGLLTLSNTK